MLQCAGPFRDLNIHGFYAQAMPLGVLHIAYASAYFKVRYLAAFTCAILNNQPMGFYIKAKLAACDSGKP